MIIVGPHDKRVLEGVNREWMHHSLEIIIDLVQSGRMLYQIPGKNDKCYLVHLWVFSWYMKMCLMVNGVSLCRMASVPPHLPLRPHMGSTYMAGQGGYNIISLGKWS